MNGVVSLLRLPDNEDTVRLLLLLLDSENVDTLDFDERPDSDPEADPDPDLDPADLVLRPVFDDRPDWAVRPASEVRSDLEDTLDMSERSDLDDSSETEDTLVLEVISDTVDKAVVDLFCSGSDSGRMLITLERETHIIMMRLLGHHGRAALKETCIQKKRSSCPSYL